MALGLMETKCQPVLIQLVITGADPACLPLHCTMRVNSSCYLGIIFLLEPGSQDHVSILISSAPGIVHKRYDK